MRHTSAKTALFSNDRFVRGWVFMAAPVLQRIQLDRSFVDGRHEFQRCLIPAAWYQEPNWETGRNMWWQLRRAHGLPWMLAGLWSEWTDPETGEVVPNFTMLTRNCNAHPLLNRLHKPDPHLKPGQPEDKRAVVHVEPDRWEAWLLGSETQAKEVLSVLPSPDFFDPTDALRTDQVLAGQAPDQSTVRADRQPPDQSGLF